MFTHTCGRLFFVQRQHVLVLLSTSSRCEREAACAPWFKCATHEKQSYDKTDAYGFSKLFLPRYSLSVCVCVCVCARRCGWGAGTCLQLTHAALSPLDRGRKTELGRVKVQHTSGEFSGIKILPVSRLELSGETRGTTGFEASLSMAISPLCSRRLNQISIICKCTESVWIQLPGKCLFAPCRSQGVCMTCIQCFSQQKVSGGKECWYTNYIYCI